MRPERPTRRLALTGSLASLGVHGFARAEDAAAHTPLGPGATFGWAALDMATGHVTSVNPDLRLPMCSTFKWLLAACVLARVQAGRDSVSNTVDYAKADLQPYSPKTRTRLGEMGGAHAHMTVGELCDAAVTVSDNGAANLLLARVGGPAALTAWLRSTGDRVTRLDRTEPSLNTALAGDPRDTTTPAAMLGDLRRILFGEVLKPQGREALAQWMLHCQTGGDRLKAGVPEHWLVKHKTGTGEHGARGDVGVLQPPSGAPILVAAYTLGSTRPDADIDRWFADIARLIVADAMSVRGTHRG